MIDIAALYRDALADHRSGDVHGAEQGYKAVLDVASGHAGTWNSLGNLFLEQKKYLESKNAFLHALAIDPRNADFHSDLASLYLLQHHLPEAAVELKTAIELQPDHPGAKKTLSELRFRQGHILTEKERYQEAHHVFGEAAALSVGNEIWRWKSLGFCPSVFSSEQAIDRYWKQLAEGLDFVVHTTFNIDWRTLPRDGFTPSFNLPHLGRCCRTVKEKFAAVFEQAFPFDRPTLKATRRGRKRLRIGFVVTAGHHRGFLRVHRHLLEKLDPRKFELFFLGHASVLRDCRQEVHRNDITWIGFQNNFAQAVESIRETRCDILYFWKVGGGTFDYFLPFAQLAPIQCTSYGTHGTSGVKAVDYYLTSPYLESPDADFHSHYSEKPFLFNHHVGFLVSVHGR